MTNIVNVPIDKLSSKEETTNYCRIILLMVDVGTETLLHLFCSCIKKQTVQSYFASKKLEIEDGKKKKVFDKSQYAKLTCSDPNPDEFDICLLIKLLTYFELSPVKLDCLQKIRNEIIGHKSRAELTKQYFECLWDQVKNILLNIARCVSRDKEKETKLKVEELKQKVLDVSDRENKIIKAFETWCQEEVTLLHENIDNVRVDVTENRESIGSLKEQVNEMTDKVKMLIKGLHDLVSGSQTQANRQLTQHEENRAEEWTIFKKLQKDLIYHYRKLFKRLSLSPLIDEAEYAVDFLETYVKPTLTIPSHQGQGEQSKPKLVTSCHDIFVNDSKPCQNIYISSPAGCGKTSLARWLALTWCQAHEPSVKHNERFIAEDVDEMRTFILLFIVFLRGVHEQECDVEIMIQKQLLDELDHSTTYTENGLKFLKNILSSVKCIIILDGLDEWSHPRGNECKLHNKYIPYIRARPLCTTLTTCRPWKLDAVRLKPGEIDLKLELNGLEEHLLKRLIDNVVTNMNTLHGKEMKADEFELELIHKKLTALSKIPVVVMQLLTVWFDNEQVGESHCQIYSNMIELLLKRYYQKKKSKINDCSRDRQTPVCLQENIYCKAHMELLQKLATLAYNTLFTDNEESSLVFDGKILSEHLTDEEIEMSLAVGILTQEKVTNKMSERQSHISFIHKTFQEYLTALYIVHLNPKMVTKVEEKIKRVCCSVKKILEMSQIFMFLSGLCPKVMVNLHEHLRQTVSDDSGTQRYRACELERTRDPCELKLQRVQETMLEWLDECSLNGHKHVTHFPVRDFFIWPSSRWSDGLKSLAVHNPVCTLDVTGPYSPDEIEDILNSVTVFSSIQKLGLFVVSDTFVVQLVSLHKHSLSVRPEAWRQLGWMALGRVRMSGDILCSLVDSILELPKSVQVRLEGCTISQGIRDWKTYIRSHPRLSVDDDDVDDDDEDDDDNRMIVNFLQFHINKV